MINTHFLPSGVIYYVHAVPCLHADGLWPDKNDGTWSTCCPGERFNIGEVLYHDCTFLDALDFRVYVNVLLHIN